VSSSSRNISLNDQLHYAVINNNLAPLRNLLEKEANPNKKNKEGKTALDLALEGKKRDLILALLKAPNISCPEAGTHILDAAKYNDLELVTALLDVPQNQRSETHGQWDVWRFKTNRNYALHYAVINNNLAMLRKLLEKGGNPNEKNKEGKTALDLALDGKKRDLILALLKAPNISCPEAGTHILDAAKYNDLELVTALLDVPEDQRRQLHGRWDGWYFGTNRNHALHYAVINNNLAMLRILLKKGANPNRKNKAGKTALDLALEGKKRDLILALLKVPSMRASSEWQIWQYKTDPAIIHLYLSIKAELDLEEAITTGDLEKVKSSLTYDLLNKPLSDTLLTPLALAIKHKQTAITEYLIMADARRPAIAIYNPPVQLFIDKHDTLVARINSLIEGFHEKIKHYPTSVLLTKMLTLLDKFKQQFDSLDNYQKMDLYYLLNFLLNALKNTANDHDLELQIKSILRTREDIILNSHLDYPNDIDSLVNEFCYELAKAMGDVSPFNVLLQKARTDKRKHAWYDPIDPEVTVLPSESKVFFRLPGNEIHLYEYVVITAIARIKDGNKRLEHIWFGTDPKNVTPVPILNKKALDILKQRSPTLNLLVHYTEILDRSTRDVTGNIIEKLTLLKNGLHAGDYRVTGDHKLAGADANVAVAEFAEWWNKQNNDLQKKLKKVKAVHAGREDNLADVIDVILSEGNVHNQERANNAVYCVNLKANTIERLLQNPQVVQQLNEIQETTLPENDEALLAGDEIFDQWQAQILAELEHPRRILVPEKGQFPDMLCHGDLNLLLIQSGLMVDYDGLIGFGFDKEKDIRKLIGYIFSANDNKFLEDLKEILNRVEYDYLRKPEKSGRYHALIGNYVLIGGERVLTNAHYAMLEKALSLQMVKNSVKDKASKEEAKIAVNELCDKNKFIANNRKGYFHLAGSSTSLLFSGYKNMQSNLSTLNHEIASVQRRLRRPG